MAIRFLLVGIGAGLMASAGYLITGGDLLTAFFLYSAAGMSAVFLFVSFMLIQPILQQWAERRNALNAENHLKNSPTLPA